MTRRQAILLLGVGLALGLALGLAAPRLAGRYLPASIVGPQAAVSGLVRAESREADRLLLTVEAPEGAILVTFRKRVAEMDLLVGVGDSLALALPGYRPFVDDPEVVRVRKAPAGGPTAGPASGSDTVR
jgi:small basic protein